MDAKLTLEKAKMMIRQREAVHEQRDILHQSSSVNYTTTLVQVISTRNRYTSHHPAVATPKTSCAIRTATQNKCKRCGNKLHSWDLCPVKDAECYKCKKRGHFSSQCLTNIVKEVTLSAEMTSPNEKDLRRSGVLKCSGLSWWIFLDCKHQNKWWDYEI